MLPGVSKGCGEMKILVHKESRENINSHNFPEREMFVLAWEYVLWPRAMPHTWVYVKEWFLPVFKGANIPLFMWWSWRQRRCPSVGKPKLNVVDIYHDIRALGNMLRPRKVLSKKTYSTIRLPKVKNLYQKCDIAQGYLHN